MKYLLTVITLVLTSCSIDTAVLGVDYLDAGPETGYVPIPSGPVAGYPSCYPVLAPEGGVAYWLCPEPISCGIKCFEEKPKFEMYPDPR
jgi:hypothetical protein